MKVLCSTLRLVAVVSVGDVCNRRLRCFHGSSRMLAISVHFISLSIHCFNEGGIGQSLRHHQSLDIPSHSVSLLLYPLGYSSGLSFQLTEFCTDTQNKLPQPEDCDRIRGSKPSKDALQHFCTRRNTHTDTLCASVLP